MEYNVVITFKVGAENPPDASNTTYLFFNFWVYAQMIPSLTYKMIPTKTIPTKTVTTNKVITT